jgi:hypothetical protein
VRFALPHFFSPSLSLAFESVFSLWFFLPDRRENVFMLLFCSFFSFDTDPRDQAKERTSKEKPKMPIASMSFKAGRDALKQLLNSDLEKQIRNPENFIAAPPKENPYHEDIWNKVKDQINKPDLAEEILRFCSNRSFTEDDCTSLLHQIQTELCVDYLRITNFFFKHSTPGVESDDSCRNCMSHGYWIYKHGGDFDFIGFYKSRRESLEVYETISDKNKDQVYFVLSVPLFKEDILVCHLE